MTLVNRRWHYRVEKLEAEVRKKVAEVHVLVVLLEK